MNYDFNNIDEFEFLTSKKMSNFSEIVHCFTTKKGGVSEGVYESLNLGWGTDDEEENISTNYKKLAEYLGINANDFVTSFQTHTNNVKIVTLDDKGKGVTEKRDYRDVDGLITNERGIALLTTHADCVPLFFYDPINQVISVVHSGWKGTLLKIAEKTIEKFVKHYNSSPENILVSIGPSLCQDCFEVDEDVKDMFLEVNPKYSSFMYSKGTKTHIDLWKINELLLTESGIKVENIENMNLCTKCKKDIFFSHRGHNGKRGIMGAVMMIKDDKPR